MGHIWGWNSVQSLSRIRLFATPWIAARQASLFITNSRSSHRLTSIESVMPFSHLILGRPLLLLPLIPPSIRPWVRKILWRRKWQPTPVLLPGKSHGRRRVVGYSPWRLKESDTTEWLHFYISYFLYIVFAYQKFNDENRDSNLHTLIYSTISAEWVFEKDSFFRLPM